MPFSKLNPRVLLVENDVDGVSNIEYELRAADNRFRVIRATTLQDAMAQLRVGLFDAILLDLSLADSDGMATFASIYAAADDRPIIVLSTNIESSLTLSIIQSGASDHIVKRDAYGTLLARSVRYAMEKSRDRAVLQTQRQRLEESNRLLAETQEIAELGTFEHDLQTHEINWSPEHCRMFGLPIDAAVDEELAMSLIHPEDRGAMSSTVHRAVTTGQPQDVIVRFYRGDDLRVCHARGRVVLDENDAPVKIIGTARDVTEQKRAEDALRDSEERYRTIVETVNEGIWTIDENACTTYVNRRMAEILGSTPVEMRGKSVYEFYPEDRATDLDPGLIRRRNGVSETFELELLRVDRTPVLCRLNTNPVFRQNGSYHGALALVTDITETRRAEEQIRFQAHLLDTVQQAVIATDTSGAIISWNRYASELFGWTGEEAIGLSATILTGSDEASTAAAALRERALQGAMLSGEFTLKRKDGSLFPAEVMNTPIVNEAGELIGTVGVASDITARRELEDQLRQSQKLEALGTLAGGIAHDFNNLLTSITGYADLLITEMPDTDPRRDDALEVVHATNRAAALTRQLLAFSRKQVLQPRVLNLSDVVRETEKMLRRLIREDIELVTRLRAAGPHIKADQGQIEQVIVNLIVNARDAMEDGGAIAIETGIVNVVSGLAFGDRVDLSDGSYAALTVTDTGLGMDQRTVQRIFEPFFTTKPVGQGTGLGLATVYGIVKQSHGAITVRSTPGSGTRFTMLLPLSDESVTAEGTMLLEKSHDVSDATILVVEDDQFVRALIVRVLRGRGYRLVEAVDGAQAIDLIRSSQPFDLLITDVIMPGMSGPQMVDLLRDSDFDTPVLFMSGYTAEEIGSNNSLTAQTDILEKPFSPTALLEKVRKILKRRANR